LTSEVAALDKEYHSECISGYSIPAL